jgi:hypothetical protein
VRAGNCPHCLNGRLKWLHRVKAKLKLKSLNLAEKLVMAKLAELKMVGQGLDPVHQREMHIALVLLARKDDHLKPPRTLTAH